jgi:predicted Zn finger-like uncharacterized protein
VVVQCPGCQSKFRIADEKVTDRGVRVRCTSCKNVFQVKKLGAAAPEAAPGPGSTVELSALDAAALRAAPRNGSAGAGRAAATAARAGAAPMPGLSPAARPGPLGVPGPNGRRLDADDLFGMSELTGDAPLQDFPQPAARPASRPAPAPAAKPAPTARPGPSRPATGPVALATSGSSSAMEAAVQVQRPAAKPVPSFDDIDLDAGDAPPAAAQPPPPPEDHDAEPSADDLEGTATPIKLGAFKTALKDPFAGMNLGGEGDAPNGSEELAPGTIRKEKDKPAAPAKAPQPAAQDAEALGASSTTRELVSSALTGLVGAALAIAVVLAAALSDESANGWLGFGAGTDVVATRVVSGLYDTVAGKPVFYVRGRVENRSRKVRGPVKVIAELVADSGTNARAEAIAGAEPTAEDVWSLRNPAEVEKLVRSLDSSEAQRRVSPGASLPFFAVIVEPPGDLERHKLHVRVEPLDAWVPPSPGKAVNKGR